MNHAGRRVGARPGATRASTALIVGLGVAWILAVATGLVMLRDYEAGPAPSGRPPTRWPAYSRLARTVGRVTLVMTAHPQCPCTRASIGELNALMARTGGMLDAFVLFDRPAGVPARWERTDLWDSAAAIPGVHAIRDDHGVEATRFAAVASGQTMVYGVDGELRFSGGITGARGRHGDNAGRSAIVALALGTIPIHTRTPVFGCALSAGSGAPTLTRARDLGSGGQSFWNLLQAALP